MHFFQHHIGEFAAQTRFMTPEEIGIFSILRDEYLYHGVPLVYDRITTMFPSEYEPAMKRVLSRCFIEKDGAFVNEAFDQMLAEYEAQAEKNRRNVQKRWEKVKKENGANANGNESNTTGNESNTTEYLTETININHKHKQEDITTESASEKKRAPLVVMPICLPEEWMTSALEVRSDVDPAAVFTKLKARYAGTTTRKAMSTWRREFMGWIGREYAGKPQAAAPVKRFTDEYYAQSLNPDGTVNWGI